MKDTSRVIRGVPIAIKDDVVSFRYRQDGVTDPQDSVSVAIEGKLRFSNGKSLVQIIKPYSGNFVEYGKFKENSESEMFFRRMMGALGVEWLNYKRLEESFANIADNFNQLDWHACGLASKYSKYDWISDAEFNARFDEYLDKRKRGLISKGEYDEQFFDILEKQNLFHKILKAFPRNFVDSCPEHDIREDDINKILYLKRKRRINEPVVLSEFMQIYMDAEKMRYEGAHSVGIFEPVTEEFILLLKTNRKELIL